MQNNNHRLIKCRFMPVDDLDFTVDVAHEVCESDAVTIAISDFEISSKVEVADFVEMKSAQSNEIRESKFLDHIKVSDPKSSMTRKHAMLHSLMVVHTISTRKTDEVGSASWQWLPYIHDASHSQHGQLMVMISGDQVLIADVPGAGPEMWRPSDRIWVPIE